MTSQSPEEERTLSIPALLRRTAASMPEHPAILCGERVIDFASFDRMSDAIAAALAQQGVEKGQRIGLYCPNSDAFALAYFGIIKAGATVVPINLLLNPKEIAYILEDAGARGLIYHAAFTDSAHHLRDNVPGLSLLVRIAEPDAASESEVLFKDMLACGAAPPAVHFDPDEDLAAILYTSGTTGRPKGAMLSHRNLVANTWSALKAMDLQPGQDVILVVLPMFHAFAATVGMLLPLLRGCTFAPLPRFDPQLVADTIEATGATVLPAVPSMYGVLLRLPEQYTRKFASLRFCISGAAAMPAALMDAFETRFGKFIYEGDGPTECSPVTCVNPIGGRRKRQSVGPALPGVEMRIMDAQGKELPRGEPGEICVRGPNVMKGYWNRADETARSFFGEWFRTGDVGTEDEDGYFYIVDRIKDLVIVNGMNVYPRVIEEILYQHPAVAEAAVVGEPNERHGEIPVAFVALRPEGKASAADIREFCAVHLGRHEVPRKVFFLPELPKNAAGKILKRELRKHGELERGIDSRDEER